MLVEFFRALGLADGLELLVNTLGDAACRPATASGSWTTSAPTAMDCARSAAIGPSATPCACSTARTPRAVPCWTAPPALADFLCAPCAEHFARVRAALDAMGLAYVVTPASCGASTTTCGPRSSSPRRGWARRTRWPAAGATTASSSCLGGPPDGGIGFAIGIERVALLLAGRTPPAPPLALLVPLGAAALARLLPVAQAVRAEGVAVDLGYGERKLRAELERANRLGATHTVIVGDQELARGEAVVREMASGQQRTVPLGALAKELLALGGRA